MTTQSETHETRISRIEGILESVATKDFVREVNAEMLKGINNKIDEQTNLMREQNDQFRELMREQTNLLRSEISEQTNLLRSEMSEQNDQFRSEMNEIQKEIKRLNEKQYRLTGAAEFIKFSLPIIISVVALLIALFRPV